jgi:CubicO group peptidase (beta-lactamase class C family)
MVAAVVSGDAAAYAADKELADEPGTRFLYNSGNTVILDRILADEVGSEQPFRPFMDAELFDKLGMDPMLLEFDGAGTWLGAYAADTTALNFAKFGLLYLRDGIWDGERILPEGWVEYSRTPSGTNPEYGAGWWLDPERPGVFYAVGVDGQVITVAPEHDLTYVTLATDGPVSLPVSEAILDAFAAGE